MKKVIKPIDAKMNSTFLNRTVTAKQAIVEGIAFFALMFAFVCLCAIA